ncbi:MAG TPA: hypothetical protein VII75_08630 [Thermoanaerobaculia bacterium]|nr:hypothetical protein [Thermoanaerobaculia bacterium]
MVKRYIAIHLLWASIVWIAAWALTTTRMLSGPRHRLQQEFLLIDGVDGATRLAREPLYDVDVIKVAIDDNMNLAKVAALADEAHRQHLKIAAHATSVTAIQTAIDADVDSIEHDNNATEEQLKTMRDKGIFLDITPVWFWSKIHEASAISPEFRAKLAAAR